MSAPDYSELPKRVDPTDTVEEVDASPPVPDEGLPPPDRDWLAAGG